MNEVTSPKKNMRLVVTGGAGFIGTHLTQLLVSEGHEVHVVDTLVGTIKRGIHPSATLHIIDVRDQEKLTALFKSLPHIDGVFHAAALPSVPFSIENPLVSHDVNVNGTLSVLAAAHAHGVGRVIFSSSSAVYGDTNVIPSNEETSLSPQSPYALHKYIGEQYCALYSALYALPTVVLRYYNVYGLGADPNGPYASAIGKFIQMQQNGQPITITGDGEQTRDMVHVRDVARANLVALTHPHLGNAEIFNVGTGTQTSINEIAHIIGGPTLHIPARHEPRHSCADITRIQALGWHPSVKLHEGIHELKAETHLQ
ncbi:MAG: NAD-dependent epimerase/dehydratase family protein [Candidatus Adlerbacteria bacterium]